MTDERVIAHIDLDCFYCQVEQLRLEIDRDIPCAVQQWQGLIAVNYAARDFGVNRFMRVTEAQRLCPQIRFLHVETIGKDGKSDTTRLDHFNAKRTRKASLERYRQASHEIVQLVKSLVPGAEMEKASIDEMYLDLTPLIEKELETHFLHTESRVEDRLQETVVIGGDLDYFNYNHKSLLAGSSITLRVREEILSKLGYTCSAGIAHNKQLAKLLSAKHKPNKQTVLLGEGSEQFMSDLPIKKIPQFGGKLGTLLEKELDCQTAGDVQRLEFHMLANLLGKEKANWVASAVRGKSEAEVKPKKKARTMTSAKSFPATSDKFALEGWIEILSIELADRISKELQSNNRLPKSMTLGWLCGEADRHTRVCPLPKFEKNGLDVKELTRAAISGLQDSRITKPCTWLALTFSNFVEGPKQGCQSIASYFCSEGNEEMKSNSDTNNAKRPFDDENNEDEFDLDNVDIEEQRRLLQFISIESTVQQLKQNKKTRESASHVKKKQKRPSILDMLRNKQD